MKIAILGTRGIPNNYGGFEQFAEYLSPKLVARGHDVTVYSSHLHPFQQKTWNGVNIIHAYNPEDRVGTFGQFIYDFNCIVDARKRNFDVILQLGYTSSSVWGRLLPARAVIVSNMDGIEWKRAKFSKKVQRFLQYAEKLAVKFSDYLIADSVGIQQYFKEKYNVLPEYIAYGATVFDTPNAAVIGEFGVSPFRYDMLVARLEPENSVEVILKGVELSSGDNSFLVCGNVDTAYGRYLKEKFGANARIKFMGSNYDIGVMNNLRYYSNNYFHGHTVGGTNPSLLEAMASQALICAHDNVYNRPILGADARYFTNETEVAAVISNVKKSSADNQVYIQNNLRKVDELYSWKVITDKYENFLLKCFANAGRPMPEAVVQDSPNSSRQHAG